MKRKVLTAIAAASVLLTGATMSISQQVVGFDFATGACLGTLVRYPNLNGMALEFF